MATAELDADGFATGFARCGRALWVLAAAWVGRGDAADLVQETARVAWERRSDFVVGSDLRAWLSQIARNLAANWRRRLRPVATSPELLAEVAQPARSGGDGHDVEVDAGVDIDFAAFEALDLPDRLAAGLAALPAIARACLLLHVVMELSFVEIAAMLDVPENTAASHARRARVRLRERLTAGQRMEELR